MLNKKMSLSKRFFIFLFPAVMLIGLTNVLHTWMGSQETTRSYYQKSMEKNLHDMNILARETTFQYYFEDQKQGYLPSLKNDLIDVRLIFSQAMVSLAEFGDTPIHMVFYDRAWNTLTNIEAELSEREQIIIREEPFISEYQDFSKPYSALVEDHHVMIFPVFGKVTKTGSQSPAVLGFIHSEVRLPLNQLKQEAYSKLVIQIQWVCAEIVFFVFLLFWVGRSVAQPFSQFCDDAQKVSKSEFKHPFINNSNSAELEILERTLNHMRDDILSRQQQLLIALDAATASSKSKSNFLANMSHEIRTPLNAVIGLSDLMRQDSMTPKNRDYLNKIFNASRSLLRIVNDILDFSKIEAGKLDLEQSDFRLRDVIDRLTDIFFVQSGEKNIEFILCVSDGCRYALKGDALRLEQVLMNLISNALKFTNQGEVEVQVLTVEESADQVELQFSVRDTGIGIAKGQAEKLFQAFSQGDGSTTRKFGGTGLGLAISRKLVEMMGGRIWMTSELHQGTCLYFTALFKRRLEDEEQDMLPPEEMARLRTLVVDDNQALGNALFKMLNLFGFDSVVVRSSLEALAKVRQGLDQQQPFQLVLVDWTMPDLDGVATAGQIKAMVAPEYQPKILLMTPYGYARNGSQGNGIDGYLTKPINCSLLFDSIMDVFGKDVVKSMRPNAEKIDLTEVLQKIGGARVLLVEDNQINQQVAEEILKGIALNVEKAENGVEAVTKVMESEYDLVLMDIQMPEMDGYEATRNIRNNPQFKDLPILAMTAHAMSGDRAKCLDSGMNDHLTKPIDKDKLYAALIQWIRPREGIGGLFPPSLISGCGKGEEGSPLLPETLPGIDMDAALKRVNANSQLLRALLFDLSATYGKSVTTLRMYLSQRQQQDFKAALGLVHTIKGVAANLSAVALYEAALALEKGIKENQPFAWPGLLDGFERCMNQLLESIDTLKANAGETSPETASSASPVVVNLEDVRPGLNRLATLLKKKDFKAMDCFEQLRPMLTGADIEADMQQLAACLNGFNFKGGQTFLAAIARTLDLSLEE